MAPGIGVAPTGLDHGRFVRHREGRSAQESSRRSTRCSTCSPAAILRDLDLRRPIYRKTASSGHFGRGPRDFAWERVSRLDDFKARSASLDHAGPGARPTQLSARVLVDVPRLRPSSSTTSYRRHCGQARVLVGRDGPRVGTVAASAGGLTAVDVEPPVGVRPEAIAKLTGLGATAGAATTSDHLAAGHGAGPAAAPRFFRTAWPDGAVAGLPPTPPRPVATPSPLGGAARRSGALAPRPRAVLRLAPAF